MISYFVVRSLMPQHDNSIRSALCTDNGPSLIGRAERIPFHCGPAGCLSLQCRSTCNSRRKAKEGLRGEFALCIHSLSVGPRLPIRKAYTQKTRQNRIERKEVVKTKQVGSREQKCLCFCIFSKWSAYETRGSRLPTCGPHARFPPCAFASSSPLK